MDNTFLTWLDEWFHSLPATSLKGLQTNPKKIAVIVVDMVVGFCSKGSLASNDIAAITQNVVETMQHAHTYGVKNFVLVQDAHDHEAEEFTAYPPHCVKGSDEADAIPEIAQLPFSQLFTTIEKNTLHPAYDTEFEAWIKKNPEVDTFIILGDCTDLCIYSMAMHLRLSANSKNQKRTIIVPENGVATYDLSVENAKKIGVMPHNRELLHKIFLYHMALNAISVVKIIK